MIFVSEEKKEISPKTEIAVLLKENSKQKRRIRNLEIHVGALQKIVLGKDEGHSGDAIASKKNDAELNLSIDEGWINQEIDQLRMDGNLTMVASELGVFLNEIER